MNRSRDVKRIYRSAPAHLGVPLKEWARAFALIDVDPEHPGAHVMAPRVDLVRTWLKAKGVRFETRPPLRRTA